MKVKLVLICYTITSVRITQLYTNTLVQDTTAMTINEFIMNHLICYG